MNLFLSSWTNTICGNLLGKTGNSKLAITNHRGAYHTPTLPTRLPYISAGGQEFEEWEAGEVGGSKRVPGANI